MYYVKNCLWHINQYFEGYGSKKLALDALDSLQKHINDYNKNR